MARLNLEDDIQSDIRFRRLVRMVGDEDKALGMLCRFWRLAQLAWGNNRGLMSCEDFALEGFEKILESGLAEQRDDGIYARGSEDRFDWYFQKCQAGRRSAKKTRGKQRPRKLNSVITEIGPRDHGNTIPLSPPVPAPAPTLVPVPTPAPALLEKEEELNLTRGSKPPRSDSPSSLVWAAYAEAYERRYGEKPVRNAMVNGQLAQFVKRIPLEEAPEVAAFYLTHTAYNYVNAMHPVGLMLFNAEKLRTEWITGRKMTGTTAKQTEKASHFQDQLARIAKGEL